MKKSDFNYYLPQELIAQHPLPERSASRLLLLDRKTGAMRDKQFTDLIDFIEPGDLLVFNNTKVIPARLFGAKSTGGKVEILVERILDASHALAHIRASKAPKPGMQITLDKGFSCTVLEKTDNLYRLKFSGNGSVTVILEQIGHIPLPPYIERADDKSDIDRYQSIFAKQSGAVAAPTASLHFDQTMLERLKKKGVTFAFVTLHVGSGTFQPVRTEDLTQHRMHKEYYEVSSEAVETVLETKSKGGRVIAIGTTAIRAVESASQSGMLEACIGDTSLFITPGYRFMVVDALLTNFHLPESTLLMLVSAFAGYEPVMAAYHHAISQSYRFFSYGDAMFISA